MLFFSQEVRIMMRNQHTAVLLEALEVMREGSAEMRKELQGFKRFVLFLELLAFVGLAALPLGATVASPSLTSGWMARITILSICAGLMLIRFSADFWELALDRPAPRFFRWI